MKLSNYELKSLQEIEEWEKKKHEGFHKKILDVTSKVTDYIMNSIGRENYGIVEDAIEGTVRSLLYASKYTINENGIIKRAHDHGIMINNIADLQRCDLETLDKCNRESINFHEKAAGIQGAISGLGGILIAAADLTTILVQDFHMIQEISFCYGYDPIDIIEKNIILQIIGGSIGGSEMKFKALKRIEVLKNIKMNNENEQETIESMPMLGAKAMEEYIEDLTVELLKNIVPRSVPILSMAVSAHSNYEIMEFSGDTAFMIYRKRFIERKRHLPPKVHELSTT